jgi:hypothetical protein
MSLAAISPLAATSTPSRDQKVETSVVAHVASTITVAASTPHSIRTDSSRMPTTTLAKQADLNHAFALLQNPDKVKDAVALKAACRELGLSTSDDLALLTEEDEAALVAHLKPLPAVAFRQQLSQNRFTSPWTQLHSSVQQTDSESVARLLAEFGVSSEAFLPYLDHEQIDALANCFKAAPRARFKQQMQRLQQQVLQY